MRLRAALLAFAFAFLVIAWTPLCVLYEPWSPQWIALGCWFGEPDPPPPVGYEG